MTVINKNARHQSSQEKKKLSFSFTQQELQRLHKLSGMKITHPCYISAIKSYYIE